MFNFIIFFSQMSSIDCCKSILSNLQITFKFLCGDTLFYPSWTWIAEAKSWNELEIQWSLCGTATWTFYHLLRKKTKFSFRNLNGSGHTAEELSKKKIENPRRSFLLPFQPKWPKYSVPFVLISLCPGSSERVFARLSLHISARDLN